MLSVSQEYELGSFFPYVQKPLHPLASGFFCCFASTRSNPLNLLLTQTTFIMKTLYFLKSDRQSLHFHTFPSHIFHSPSHHLRLPHHLIYCYSLSDSDLLLSHRKNDAYAMSINLTPGAKAASRLGNISVNTPCS